MTMNYAVANEQMTGRCADRRKVGNNTYLERRADHIALRLHATDILKYWPDGSVEYYAGNWQTWTTKDRFNKFGPLAVWSDRCVWYAGRRGGDAPRVAFADGMTVLADGTVVGAGEDPKALSRERNRVKAWVKCYMDALEAGQIAAPGPGDCFYCYMITAEGKPLGDAQGDRDHLHSHMSADENYFVPSLLRNALQAMGASQSMWWWLGSYWDANASAEQKELLQSARMSERPRVEKALRRYVLRALGFAV